MAPTQKYYVTNNGSITIQCLGCKKSQTIAVESLKLKNNILKVRCSCANTFVVAVEFRKAYRKKVAIEGGYRKKSESGESVKPCMITDISLGGLAFQIKNDPTVQVEDELVVRFSVDGRERDAIDTAVLVRHLDASGERIGGAFIGSGEKPGHEAITLFLK